MVAHRDDIWLLPALRAHNTPGLEGFWLSHAAKRGLTCNSIKKIVHSVSAQLGLPLPIPMPMDGEGDLSVGPDDIWLELSILRYPIDAYDLEAQLGTTMMRLAGRCLDPASADPGLITSRSGPQRRPGSRRLWIL